MELKKIYVVLAAKVNEFDDAMAKVGGKIATAGKSLEEMGKSMSATGAAMTKGITLPVIGAGVAILALVTKSAAAADALETMSKQTGLSVGKLQELRYVASQTNTNFETITMAVATMTRNMVASDEEGSKMAAAFETIGVKVKNVDGSFRDMNDVFPETLKALADMPPGVERNNLLMQIFGTRAKELIPLLSAGAGGIDALTARAHELGLVTPGTNKVLADFNDKMDEVKQVVAAAFAQLAAKFLPILREVVPLLTDKVVPAVTKFADWIGGLIDKFTSLSPQTQHFILALVGVLAALGPVLSILGGVTTKVGGFMASLTDLNPTILLIKVSIGLLMVAIAYLITHWDDVRAAGIRAWTGIKPYIQPIIDLVKWCSDAIQDVIKWFGSLFGIKKGSLAANVAEVADSVENLEAKIWKESLVPALDAWAAATVGVTKVTREMVEAAKDAALATIREGEAIIESARDAYGEATTAATVARNAIVATYGDQQTAWDKTIDSILEGIDRKCRDEIDAAWKSAEEVQRSYDKILTAAKDTYNKSVAAARKAHDDTLALEDEKLGATLKGLQDKLDAIDAEEAARETAAKRVSLLAEVEAGEIGAIAALAKFEHDQAILLQKDTIRADMDAARDSYEVFKAAQENKLQAAIDNSQAILDDARIKYDAETAAAQSHYETTASLLANDYANKRQLAADGLAAAGLDYAMAVTTADEHFKTVTGFAIERYDAEKRRMDQALKDTAKFYDDLAKAQTIITPAAVTVEKPKPVFFDLLKGLNLKPPGFQAGGWLTRPTLLTDYLTGVPYGIAAEHGPEEIVAGGRGAGEGAAGDTYNVTLNVRADEIDEVQKVIGVFKGLKQTARAMGVAVT